MPLLIQLTLGHILVAVVSEISHYAEIYYKISRQY